MSNIVVRKVGNDKKDMEKFLKLPWKIYKNDKIWVAPLISTYKNIFDPAKSPFFEHGHMEYFIAEQNGETIGRIAAIKNPLHNETWHDKVGFFGFFECIDDQNVANALLNAAKVELQSWGFDKMRGPASPSSNEDYGVLYDNFEDQQVLISTYNAPYYYKLYNNYGLNAIKELYAFRFDGKGIIEQRGEQFERLKKSVMERTGVVFEDLDMKKFAEGVMTFKGIFNNAWTTNHNHGWVPLTEREFDAITADLKPITNPKLVMLAKINGEVVGGCICLPDYNEIFRSWRGKLFPFNWIDMFTKKKKIKCLRIVILGVLPEYQKKGIDAIMYYEITKRGLAEGMTWAEASYIVEDNEPMKKPLLNIGGEVYKRYKVMEQDI